MPTLRLILAMLMPASARLFRRLRRGRLREKLAGLRHYMPA